VESVNGSPSTSKVSSPKTAVLPVSGRLKSASAVLPLTVAGSEVHFWSRKSSVFADTWKSLADAGATSDRTTRCVPAGVFSYFQESLGHFDLDEIMRM